MDATGTRTDLAFLKALLLAKTQNFDGYVKALNDFIKDYNSYKGNAYGLANILTQTAFLRPKIKSRKVRNLFFTGQLTVPGPGVPPSIISGKIVSEKILKSN